MRSLLKPKGNHHVLRVKGLPAIEIRPKRELPEVERLRSVTITRRGRRLFMNLTYKLTAVDLPSSCSDTTEIPTSGSPLGLDMGVTDRIALSNGEPIERRDKDTDRLIRAQQRLSRCRKGSRRWRERRAILANLQHRERVRNRNECHRITTDLVRRFDLIAIEDLAIRNMTRSAKGTIEEPGKYVAAKAGLNRSITEQTWGIIGNQLAYKAEWAGRGLVTIDPKFTSQTCSECGVVDAKARRGKSFECRECRTTIDADTNAAINILKRAMAGVDFPPPSREAA